MIWKSIKHVLFCRLPYIRNQCLTVGGYLQRLSQSSSTLAHNERLFGKDLTHSTADLYHLILEEIRRSDGLSLLNALAFFGPVWIPEEILDLLVEQTKSDQQLEAVSALATAHLPVEYSREAESDYFGRLLKSHMEIGYEIDHQRQLLVDYRLLEPVASGHYTIHPILQQFVRAQADRETEIASQVLIANVLADHWQHCYSSGDKVDHIPTLLPHGETLMNIASPPTRLKRALVRTAHWIIYDNITIDNTVRAVSLTQQILDWVPEVYPEQSIERAYCFDCLGRLLTGLGESTMAEPYARAAKEIEANFPPKLFKSSPTLAQLRARLEKFKGARESIRYFRERLPKHQNNAAANKNIADILWQMGTCWVEVAEGNEAQQCYETAIKTYREHCPKERGSLGKALIDLGRLMENLESAGEAQTVFEEAASILEEVYDQTDGLEEALICLAENHANRESYDKAIPLYEKAVELYEVNSNRFHQEIARALHSLGRAYLETDRVQEAKSALARALAIRQCSLPAVSFKPITAIDVGSVPETNSNSVPATDAEMVENGTDPKELGNLLRSLGQTFYLEDNNATAVNYFERALKLLRNAQGLQPFRVGFLWTELGMAHHRLNHSQKAKNALENALVVFQQLAKVFGEQSVDAEDAIMSLRSPLQELVSLLVDQGDTEGAIDRLEACLPLFLNHPNLKDSAATFSELFALGARHAEASHFLRAAYCFEQALPISIKLYGPSHGNTGTARFCWGSARLRLGDYRGAYPLIEEGLRICREAYGTQSQSVALGVHNLGVAQWRLGDFGGGKATLQAAVQLAEEGHEWEKKVQPMVYLTLSKILIDLGEFQEAIVYADRSVQLRQRPDGQEDSELPESLSNAGHALHRAGQLAKAMEYHDRAVEMACKLKGPKHIDLGEFQRRRGDAYRESNRFEEGLQFCYEGYSILREAYGEEHPYVVEALHSLGLCYLVRGQVDEAREALSRAVSLAMNHPSLGPSHPYSQRYQWNLNSLPPPQYRQPEPPRIAEVSPVRRESISNRRRLETDPLLSRSPPPRDNACCSCTIV